MRIRSPGFGQAAPLGVFGASRAKPAQQVPGALRLPCSRLEYEHVAVESIEPVERYPGAVGAELLGERRLGPWHKDTKDA